MQEEIPILKHGKQDRKILIQRYELEKLQLVERRGNVMYVFYF